MKHSKWKNSSDQKSLSKCLTKYLLAFIGISSLSISKATGHEVLSTEEQIANCVTEIARRHFKLIPLTVVISEEVTSTALEPRSPGNPSIKLLDQLIIAALNNQMKWDLNTVTFGPSRANHSVDTLEMIFQYNNIKQNIIIVEVDESDEYGWLSQVEGWISLLLKSSAPLVITIVKNAPKHKEALLTELYSTFLRIGFLDIVTILHGCSEEKLCTNSTAYLIIYTWMPQKNDCRNNDFIPVTSKEIVEIDKWILEGRGRFEKEADLFPEKLPQRLTGCKLYINKETSSLTELSLWKMFTDLADTLQIQTVDDPMIANTISCTTSALEPNDISLNTFTPLPLLPPVTSNVKVYIPCNKPKPRSGNIISVFSWSVWLGLFFATFFVILVTPRFYNKYETSHYSTVSSSTFCTWAVLMSVSVPEQPYTNRLRMFFIFWVWICFVMSVIFQNFFTSFLVDPGFQKQISKLEELKTANVTIVYFFLELIFFEDLNGFGCITPNIMDCLVSQCSDDVMNSDCAFMGMEILAKLINSKQRGKGKVCALKDVTRFQLFTCSMAPGTILFDQISRAWQRSFESGIMNYIQDYHAELNYHKEYTQLFVQASLHEESTSMYFILSLNHLKVTFYLLITGYCVSFLLLFLELYFPKLFSRRK
ncbi:Ionotropic receptor 700 [Blattella germanica]|nr:Ionotropic receptor 700 [Blattella germanica]